MYYISKKTKAWIPKHTCPQGLQVGACVLHLRLYDLI